jgi:hypothetical protein
MFQQPTTYRLVINLKAAGVPGAVYLPSGLRAQRFSQAVCRISPRRSCGALSGRDYGQLSALEPSLSLARNFWRSKERAR